MQGILRSAAAGRGAAGAHRDKALLCRARVGNRLIDGLRAAAGPRQREGTQPPQHSAVNRCVRRLIFLRPRDGNQRADQRICTCGKIISALFHTKTSLGENAPVGGDHNHVPGQKFAAHLNGAAGGIFQSAAAGHLHPQDGDTADLVVCEDGAELFRIIPLGPVWGSRSAQPGHG